MFTMRVMVVDSSRESLDNNSSRVGTEFELRHMKNIMNLGILRQVQFICSSTNTIYNFEWTIELRKKLVKSFLANRELPVRLKFEEHKTANAENPIRTVT